MKKMKTLTAYLVAVMMLLSCMAPFAFAQDESITLKIANYNVAGLPNVGSWLGQNDVSVSDNQLKIGQYFTDGKFDIVAVQEDFTYHDKMVSTMSGYNYQTVHSGSFLGGDGMNVFTSRYPVYNVTRDRWNQLAGVIEGGADELSSKGLMYCVIEIADGVYIDFYNIHADAYDSPEDRAAREDNYRQVTDLIVANYEKNNRPVVIVGDFNFHFHGTPEESSNIHYYFLEKCGLKDAWVELYNGGDYYDFESWKATHDRNHFDHYWGRWDSVEKVMYKNGGGIEIDAESFRYQFVTNEKGQRVSDHASAECELRFTKTADFVENAGDLNGGSNLKSTMITDLMGFFKILLKLFANLDQVFALL